MCPTGRDRLSFANEAQASSLPSRLAAQGTGILASSNALLFELLVFVFIFVVV